MSNVTLKYIERVLALMNHPKWVSPVLEAMLLIKAPDGRIYLDDLTRDHIAADLNMKRNAVNQAIFQMTQRRILLRQGRAFLPQPEVFPNIDYTRVHRLRLIVDVDNDVRIYLGNADDFS